MDRAGEDRACFVGLHRDAEVNPARPIDVICPFDVVGWAACEQFDIVTNTAMGFPPNPAAMWHAVAMVEESFFERRYVGDQAGPGLIARVVTQYDDIALLPPEYFHPTVAEVARNPDGRAFTKAAHVFAGTWLDENKGRYAGMWEANR